MQHIKRILIEALGGFPTVDAAIDEIQRMDLPERKKVLTLAVRRLFNTIGPDDILHEDAEGRWIAEGMVVDERKRRLYAAEAAQIEGSELWKVMQRDAQWQANRRMYILGKTEQDLIAGKLWTFTFDAFRTRLASIAAGSAKFNHKG